MKPLCASRCQGKKIAGIGSVLTAALVGAVMARYGPALHAENRPDSTVAGPAASAGKASLAETVHRLRPSVLAVGTYDVREKPSIRYFGTAFVVADGNVAVTNAHVVQELERQGGLGKLRVFLPQAVSLEPQPIDAREAKLLAQDEFHDIALLRFEGSPVPPVPLEKQLAEPGRVVAVLGYPIGTVQGLLPAVHCGVVSALVPASRPAPSGTRLSAYVSQALANPYLVYQLDLVIFPGHSGSPLFDVSDGRVLGIVNRTLGWRSREQLLSQPTAIGYAVPSLWVLQLLESCGIQGSMHSTAPPDPKTSANRFPTAEPGGE